MSRPTVGGADECRDLPKVTSQAGQGGGYTMLHSAQSQHTNYWAPRTRKRHQQEHRPQRPTESSDPTQHAKGRTGDRPGPRKGATTRRNVTQGAGCGFDSMHLAHTPRPHAPFTRPHASHKRCCTRAHDHTHHPSPAFTHDKIHVYGTLLHRPFCASMHRTANHIAHTLLHASP